MLNIGSIIDGKYKILNIIGKGGMSVVYLAMNEKANKQWAIKEIFRDEYQGFRLDKKEIEMMKRLKHPRLPSIIDVIEQENSLLIVMDYIEGRSLQDILTEYGARPQDQVIEWARQLCGVLVYLHSRKPAIIYRDMKPANVMLKPDGNVMLIDFGAAREYKPHNIKDTVSLGTRGYAAPEQYEKREQSDARTDIYCLGVMLFQLLTGENPHNLRPICEINPSLSSGLETILIKCTQVEKENRYQSCEELMYALDHYQEMDFAYRKTQKTKLYRFAVLVVFTGLLGLGTVFFKAMETDVRENNYEAFLQAAQNSALKEEEIENYQKAIRLDPFREEAYLSLLEDGFLDDQILTSEESRQLRAILIDYGDRNITNERVFQENREGYARFAYQAGIAYYYKFEEKSNKKNAKGYFEIAAASDCLKPGQTERARRLYVISEYYARIGLEDAAGDQSVTYLDYWKDLTVLSDGNLVKTDNERTAIVMYAELTGQLILHTAEFKNAGVKKEEMLACLESVGQHLASDFTELDESGRKWLEEDLQKLSGNLEKAERMVRSAYEQRTQEE